MAILVWFLWTSKPEQAHGELWSEWNNYEFRVSGLIVKCMLNTNEKRSYHCRSIYMSFRPFCWWFPLIHLPPKHMSQLSKQNSLMPSRNEFFSFFLLNSQRREKINKMKTPNSTFPDAEPPNVETKKKKDNDSWKNQSPLKDRLTAFKERFQNQQYSRCTHGSVGTQSKSHSGMEMKSNLTRDYW